jgi:hypothetical protein
VIDQQVHYSISGPQQGVATVTLQLSPGTYVIEAYYLSARDGSIQGMDNHTFTVH